MRRIRNDALYRNIYWVRMMDLNLHGMVSWNGNGLDMPDFLSGGAYILIFTIHTVSY